MLRKKKAKKKETKKGKRFSQTRLRFDFVEGGGGGDPAVGCPHFSGI